MSLIVGLVKAYDQIIHILQNIYVGETAVTSAFLLATGAEHNQVGTMMAFPHLIT